MKRFASILLALCLLCTVASAATLTGRTGFNTEYPEDQLRVLEQYGHSSILMPSDETETGFNLEILAIDSGKEQQDPVAYLTNWAAELGEQHSEATASENSKGAKVWSIRYIVADSVNWIWLIQQDGKEFQIMSYMSDCEDKYLPAAQTVVDNFAVDLNGDLSGFSDSEEDGDDDIYSDLLSRYDSVLRKYGLAVYEGWDIEKLDENGISLLTRNLEDPASILISFIDLGGNLSLDDFALAVFTSNDGTGGADLLGLYVQGSDGVKTVVTSGDRDQYSLVRDANSVYTLEEAGSNSAFQSGAMYYHVNADGELLLIEGVLYDSEANESAPWFLTHDTDWDAANDTPCTEEEAAALQAGYTAVTDLDIGLTLESFMTVDMGLDLTSSN